MFSIALNQRADLRGDASRDHDDGGFMTTPSTRQFRRCVADLVDEAPDVRGYEIFERIASSARAAASPQNASLIATLVDQLTRVSDKSQ